MATKQKLISRRTGDSWALQPNEDLQYCDECKKQLWLSPAGKKYCNTDNCGTDYAQFHEIKPLTK